MTKLTKNTIIYFQEATLEEKLNILRHEMIVPIQTIQIVETLLREMNWQAEDAFERMEALLDQLSSAGSHLQEVLEVVTGKHTT